MPTYKVFIKSLNYKVQGASSLLDTSQAERVAHPTSTGTKLLHLEFRLHPLSLLIWLFICILYHIFYYIINQ